MSLLSHICHYCHLLYTLGVTVGYRVSWFVGFSVVYVIINLLHSAQSYVYNIWDKLYNEKTTMPHVCHYCHTSIITITLLHIFGVTEMICDSNEEIVLNVELHRML